MLAPAGLSAREFRVRVRKGFGICGTFIHENRFQAMNERPTVSGHGEIGELDVTIVLIAVA